MKLVLRLGEIREEDHPIVGGKAASLGVLSAAGFLVPAGFVLTTEAHRLATAAFATELKKVEAEFAGGKLPLHESWPFLGELRDRLLAAPLPEPVLLEVRRGLEGLEGPLAVRSSGAKEDLEGTSFAGQYETFLSVEGEAAVVAAIQQCWASAWRNRVLQYAARRAGGATGLAMAVVVQRLVPAEVAGVLFTVNPLTGREREVLVESVFGLGEALVSGKADPDRFVLDATTGTVLSKTVKERPTLDEARLRDLAAISGALQEHYGRPLDVEWALAKGAIHLLQARPVTKLTFAPDVGEWTTADFRDGGVASDVCSPFMWSLYESVLERTLPEYFTRIKLLEPGAKAKWSRMFFARPYWNLGEVKRVLGKVPGFDERNFDQGLGVEIAYEGRGRRTPVTLGGILGVLPALFALKRDFREQLEADRRFKEAFPARKAPFDLPTLESVPREELARRFRELVTGLYHETESTYFYTIYNTTNSKTDFHATCDKVRRHVPDLDELALVGGLLDLSHLRPIQDLFQLTRGSVTEETIRAFARRWRHHGRKELDIRVPRWGEDLEFVRTLFRQVGTHAPEAQARAQHERFLKEKERIVRKLRWHPFLRRRFLAELELVRSYAWWREEMRDHSTWAYYLVRHWALEVSRRFVTEGVFGESEDVWYLAFQDVLALLEGALPADEARARVRAGRRLVRSFRNFRNPGEIGGGRGLPAAKAPEGALRGIGGSPGRATGRARVVRRLEEAGRVEAGDILVTPFTDPGWTPLLGRVAAVVTETGGVLSHAAVISREYGIPAVLAVRGAVDAIPDGATIEIDGTSGTVVVR